MQNAETLLGIIRDRGKRGLPLKRVYPLLYNPDLYLLAYARLYANKGAMTPGATQETVDGMSRMKIDRLIDELRHERFRWTPVRRVHIPKKSGKLRPLGLPTWTDKLLQEVMRSILDAYFEPQIEGDQEPFVNRTIAALGLTMVARLCLRRLTSRATFFDLDAGTLHYTQADPQDIASLVGMRTDSVLRRHRFDARASA